MGRGQTPHKGYADQKWPDGRWSGPTRHGDDPDPVALQAVCSCGWRSGREHPVPRRPSAVKNEYAIESGPVWDAWLVELEEANERCWEDWRTGHFEPLLGYEPHTQLILGRENDSLTHFLDGRPVHAGATLELLLDDGSWLPIRYEWRSRPEASPRAHVALGLPSGAGHLVNLPRVSFDLPPSAIVRWPDGRRPS